MCRIGTSTRQRRIHGYAQPGGVMKKKLEHCTRTIMSNLDEKVEIIYRHQTLMSDYSSIPRDYGTGYLMSEVEAHTLGYIQEETGLTATRLAEITNRTKGTISQVVGKLEDQGLIYREVNPDNKREYRLFVTEEGLRFCIQHKAYDRERTLWIISELLHSCTPEEIDAFFKILLCRTEIFSRIVTHDKSELKKFDT